MQHMSARICRLSRSNTKKRVPRPGPRPEQPTRDREDVAKRAEDARMRNRKRCRTASAHISGSHSSHLGSGITGINIEIPHCRACARTLLLPLPTGNPYFFST